MWPESWLRCGGAGAPDGAACAAFASRWVASHAAAAAALRKPLLVTEFGMADADARADVYAAVYGCVERALEEHEAAAVLPEEQEQAAAGALARSCAARSALAGTCVWMVAHASYPAADGTALEIAPPPQPRCAALQQVARHAALVQAWNATRTPRCATQ